MRSESRTIPCGATSFCSVGKGVTFAKKDEEGAVIDRFTFNPYSGQQFAHWYWGKLAFDVAGIKMRKDVIPALKDHDSDKLVGEIDVMSVDGAIVEFSGDFLDTDDAKKVKSVKKMQWDCSLAFDPESAKIEYVDEEDEERPIVNGEEFSGSGYIVRACEISEVSFCHHGAVPGATSSFSDSDSDKQVTIFLREEEVDEVKIKEDAHKEVLAHFKLMNEMCKDAEFVATSFKSGMSISEFKDALFAKVQAENAELSAKVTELNAEVEELKKIPAPAVSFSGDTDAPAVEAEPETYLEYAKFVAKRDGVSMSKAYALTASEKPELMDSYYTSQRRGAK